MPIAKLIHNPKAGDKDHSKEKLIELIESEGFTCEYASFKEEGWENIRTDTDILVIVGGDGTVRKVTKHLIQKPMPCLYLVGLIPMGTANNIAKTIGLQGDMADIVHNWHNKQTKNFDLVMLNGLPENNFFMEGFGFGIFPQLMEDMKKVDKKKLDTPDKEIKKALEVLLDIVNGYKARNCRVVADGEVIEGSFLLVEVMNIRSLGPNLLLAPDADPGDGLLDVALLPASERELFRQYLTQLISGAVCPPYAYEIYRGKNIEVKWDGTVLHADDEMIRLDIPAQINLEINTSALKFLAS